MCFFSFEFAVHGVNGFFFFLQNNYLDLARNLLIYLFKKDVSRPDTDMYMFSLGFVLVFVVLIINSIEN